MWRKAYILSSNLGAFYRFISRGLNSVAFVAPLVNCITEIAVSTDVDKANVPNDYFAPVFVQKWEVCGSDTDRVNSCTRDSINLSPLAVQKVLRKVKGHASAGSDGPACFYKKLARCRFSTIVYLKSFFN